MGCSQNIHKDNTQ